uniref:Uncharacterized protein n=1 Tax=Moschus moschiferus TaxID=68415 RepID=A0A8C6CI58_MOSMO
SENRLQRTQKSPSQEMSLPFFFLVCSAEKSCIWALFTIYPYRAGSHHYRTLSLFSSKVSLDFYF